MTDVGLPVRVAALDYVAQQLVARSDEVARLITSEMGKPLKWSRVEAARAAATFRWASEEARRSSGELQRLDTDAASAGRLAIVRRFPRGPVLGITPFNFPINLVAHKVAPAVAVGTPIVIKPAPRTPECARFLAGLFADTELPADAVQVRVVSNSDAPALVADPAWPVVSFTGSASVGWQIRRAVPTKHVTLELGGNAAVVVTADYGDLAWAAQRIATFAHYQAGQSCISVQRVYCARSRFDELVAEVVAATEALRVGDPADEATDVGPMIDEAAATRALSWIADAVRGGAAVLTGGTAEGAQLAPTVLVNVAPDAQIQREEAFAPVVTITPFDTLDEAFALVNASVYGLQAGVFTDDIAVAFAAHRRLDVGGVIIGDVPSYRADQMPYGGVKASGIGREGVRSTMDDYTEPRTLVLTHAL